jgi:hypothetical protein
MKKGVVFSSKDESGWRGGVCERLLDEIDENLDENGTDRGRRRTLENRRTEPRTRRQTG